MFLNKISLEISANQVIGFVGASEAGKTTLIDIILGLIPDIDGKFCLDGEELKSENLRSGKIKLVVFLKISSFLTLLLKKILHLGYRLAQ